MEAAHQIKGLVLKESTNKRGTYVHVNAILLLCLFEVICPYSKDL